MFKRRKQDEPEVPAYEFISLDPVAEAEWKPVPAGRAQADWLRRMPLLQDSSKQRTESNATLKACPGVMDYVTQGFIIPMWTDIIIQATPEGFEVIDSGALPAPHFKPVTGFEPRFIPGMPLGEHQHEHIIKFDMPWRVKAPDGWSSLLVQPWFHVEDRWELIPGIVDHDYFHSLNFVGVWNMPIGEETIIKAGTPMGHLIPIKRQDFRIETSYDQEAWHDLGARGRGGAKRIAIGGYKEFRRRKRAGEV